MKKTLLLIVLALSASAAVTAQKSPPSRICGDPSAACAKRALFDDDDIPFEYNENAVVAETAPFYIVVVKSMKLAADADCDKTPEDFSRRSIQWNFPRNKVFVARGCYSMEHNYYTKLGENVIALAIYAGQTKAQADAFLKKVKALQTIDAKDAYVLRTSTGFNGT